ncbi:hypothetical protein LCGC14_2594960, partial [marine sediment metagenome]
MAFPAAPVEAGADKIHFLTSDGNTAKGWFSVYAAATTTASSAVGFAAVATHVHDDPAAESGGLPSGSAPLVLVGGVRDDALGGLTPAAGDSVYLLVDANGALWTHDDAIDNLAGVVYADDGNWTNNVSTHLLVGGVYQSGGNTITDGDVGPLEVDSAGRLKVSIEVDNVGIGGGTQYTEDVATANPQVGTATMMERDDVLSAVTPVAGDWIGLRGSAEGALWVQDFNSDALLAKLTAAAASFVKLEDVASANADAGVPAMARRTASPADTSGANLDYEMLQMDNGRLWVSSQLLSGAVASGAYASGALASGSIASGALASGALASGSVASGALAAGAVAAGATSFV